MTDAQRRHLEVSVRYIDQLLEEATGAISCVPDARRSPIVDALHAVRGEVLRFAERMGLDLQLPRIDPFHAVRVQLSVASVSVSEMRSRAMRGYGPLDAPLTSRLDAACDSLDGAIHRAQQAVDAC